MGRKALFTEAEVFAKADEIAAQGLYVSATRLLAELGGGSLGTMQKHSDKWNATHATKEESEAAHNAEMPKPIRSLFNSLWKAMEAETSRKLSRYHEYCDSQIERYKQEAQESGAYAIGIERENEQLEETVLKLRDSTSKQEARVEEFRTRVEQLENMIGAQLRKSEEQESQLRAELKNEREQRLSDLEVANCAEKDLTAEVVELRTINKNLKSTLEQSEACLAKAQDDVRIAREVNDTHRGVLQQVHHELESNVKAMLEKDGQIKKISEELAAVSAQLKMFQAKSVSKQASSSLRKGK